MNFGQALLKRGDGGRFVVVGGEEIQQADHLESLHRELGGFEEPDGAAGLLGGGEMADQHANAAGIDGGDAFEVEDNFRVALAEEFIDSGIEAVECGTHAKAPGKLDNFDAVHSFRIDVQRRPP